MRRWLALGLLASAMPALSQNAPAPRTADQDRQIMLDRLGITALRPGANGDENAPDHANYDEAKANPFPVLPDPLVTADGRKVTTPRCGGRCAGRRSSRRSSGRFMDVSLPTCRRSIGARSGSITNGWDGRRAPSPRGR